MAVFDLTFRRRAPMIPLRKTSRRFRPSSMVMQRDGIRKSTRSLKEPTMEAHLIRLDVRKGGMETMDMSFKKSR